MNDIKDVKLPIGLFDFGPLLWLFLGLLVLAAVVFFLFRYKKSSLPVQKSQTPEMTSWEKAYKQLDALAADRLLDQGLFKEFFTRVANIARHYMEDRFNIRAPHMSSEEFLYYLGVSCQLNESQNMALKEFLNTCDMVKFAKYSPTMAEARKNFDLAKKLVDDTKI